MPGSRFAEARCATCGRQQKTKASGFEFAISRPAAKALGLTLPPTLLTLADEVLD